jgi:hypothetical protein
MRQGCKIIDLGNGKVIMCGGEPTDHKCNEDAICYYTNEGRYFFNNKKEAEKWFNDNYMNVISGSVACSICGRAAIDNAMWL